MLHEMDIFFEGLNILISTFGVCADGFQDLSTDFNYPVPCINFYLLLWNYLLILKMKPFPQYSPLCYWSMFSNADLSLATGKMCKSYFFTGSFWFDFTELQVASCKHFQCQNLCFRVFEALLEWFSKLVSNCKGASWNLEFDFFIN